VVHIDNPKGLPVPRYEKELNSLRERYQWIWKGLFDADFQRELDHLKFYSLSVVEIIDSMMSDNSPRVPAHELIFQNVLQLAEQLMEEAGDGIRSLGKRGPRRPARECIAMFHNTVDYWIEAASLRGADTRGKQLAALRFRRPSLHETLHLRPKPQRAIHQRSPKRSLELLREMEAITKRINSTVPRGSLREESGARRAFDILCEEFPELRSKLGSYLDLVRKTPQQVASIVFAERYTKKKHKLSPEQVPNLMTKCREIVAFSQNLPALCKTSRAKAMRARKRRERGKKSPPRTKLSESSIF